MEEKAYRQFSILGQILFFSLVFAASFFEEVGEYPFSEALLDSLAFVFFPMVLCYFNYLILMPQIYDRKRYVLYATLLLVLIPLFIWINFQISSAFFQDYEYYTPWSYIAIYSPYYILIVGASALYRLLGAWFENIKIQANLKNEKLQTELKFLKAQINPHFLFNTLNNIYAYATIQHPDTPEMIGKLAEILRYMVYDCQEDKIALSKEVQAMENLFGLYRLKNDEQQNLTFEQNGVKSNHEIAPLLLINLLENAFKHSDALSNLQGFIRAQLRIDEGDKLHFEIVNSIKKRHTATSDPKKLGFENIKQQLDLTYKKAYEFDSGAKDGIFTLRLSVPINRKDE